MEAIDAQPPKPIEQIAADKISDPYSQPYPLWHQTRIAKVEDILREGIVSEHFAKEIGKKDFSRRGDASWNFDYVSLQRGSSDGGPVLSTHPAFLVEPHDQQYEAKDGFKLPTDSLTPFPGEILVKRRIAPREIKGIQIMEPDDSSQILESILQVFGRIDPSSVVPVYDEEGLIWPERMTREQLRDRVQSQE